MLKQLFMEALTSGDLYLLNDLINKGIDPSSNDNEALCIAARLGYSELVERLLIDERVDPTANDHAAVYWAAYFNHSEVIEKLLQDTRVQYAVRRMGLSRPALTSRSNHLMPKAGSGNQAFMMSETIYA